jgi:hypothetical protein
MLASIVTPAEIEHRRLVARHLFDALSAQYPTNTLLWFYHVTKRSTRPTLLFQSLKGSDPFRQGTSCSLAALGDDALCQHLATKRHLIKTVSSPPSVHTLSLKRRARSPRKMKARSPGLAEERN